MIKRDSIQKPYLLFLGDVTTAEDAKTSLGIAQWRPEWCVGQIKLPGCVADTTLPNLTISEAMQKGARTLIVGVAPLGRQLSEKWLYVIKMALASGLDVAAGLHIQLSEIKELQEISAENGTRITDIRYTKHQFTAGTPRRRAGKRILTVGTDCAVGKKYTALALEKSMKESRFDASFRATGQTGMFIAESGVAIDSVIADFIAGAAEWLTPDGPEHHWDVIEGQGALCHPSFAGVTLGLIHGSQPDYIVLCHKAGNTHLMDWPEIPLPKIEDYIQQYLNAARVVNQDTRLLGISFNTSNLPAAERGDFLRLSTERFGVPCIDPIWSGAKPLVDHLLSLHDKAEI